MSHEITPDTLTILRVFGDIKKDVQVDIDLASADARDEWHNFEDRFPSAEDVTRGFLGLSDEELSVMCAKARRFRDILSARRSDSTAARTSQPESRYSRARGRTSELTDATGSIDLVDRRKGWKVSRKNIKSIPSVEDPPGEDEETDRR